MIIREESPTSRYFLFGLPKLATNIIIGFADFSLATLYILAYRVPIFLVAIGLSLGKLTVAFSFFFFGWISDIKYTRWGRRKPYLIIMSPILGLSFIFLLMPNLMISLSDKFLLFIWLIVWYQIFNITYALTAPYGAWMAEQFRFYERPKASQFDFTFASIGTAIMAIFSLIILTGFIGKIQKYPSVIPPEYFFSVIFFGVLVVILFYLVSFLMPTEPHFKIESNIFQNLKTILKNKNYISVNIMIGIGSLAWVQISSLILLFLEVVLVFEEIYYIIGAAIFLLGILFFIYIWRVLIYKLGKKRCLLYIFLSAIVFLPFTLLALIPMISTFIYGLLFIIGIAGCIAGWYLLQPIYIADIAEDDEKTTGELKAGIYKGFPSIFLNIFQSLGLLMMGIILSLPTITVRNSTFSIGYILWGPICSVILIIAYLYSKKYVKLDFEWEKLALNDINSEK
ncbi:MAG: MFS transporter [Promethearchaeota archaeon]|nr:MAG: MFS transporter [Candidatus Lokiarchaeota archaeon]